MAKKSKERENEELISPLVPTKRRKNANRDTTNSDVCFVGKPLSDTEASDRWPHRYQSKSKVKREEVAGSKEEGSKIEEKEVLLARCHYTQAMVDGTIYNLNDDAYVQAEDGKPNYIARIIELFEGIDRELYFTAQWFYRAEDTVIKDHAELIDKRRVFLSDIKDENPLNCIVSKVKIALVSPNVDLVTKEKAIPPCDLYYDMKYSLSYLTFANIVIDNLELSKTERSRSSISSDTKSNHPIGDAIVAIEESKKSEMTLLDLYSGCGAMSTGLSIGAVISGVKLLPRWAVDINPHACESLRLNHAKTEVRNEAAEDFLALLKAWTKLCEDFSLFGSDQLLEQNFDLERDDDNDNDEEEDDDGDEGSMVPDVDFEVQNLLAVCYGDPNKIKKPGLYFKVRWKGYGSSEDTWEPIEGLSQCKEKLKEFVMKGYKSKILPLPGDVDFICGGPPCQGVSGFNRFRNQEAPLDDVKNRQLLVFMDIIEHLKPRYVLMENVVDILKFAGGFLGRYAMGRLVSMNYQAKLGMMAAGSYGLPQFRMRVFLWGACPTEKLPQYPLPTHKVNARKFIPNEFEEIHVGSVIDEHCMLQEALCLENAISDLPPVTNDESEDIRKYGTTARTEFQRYIRLKRNDMVTYMADVQSVPQTSILYDHRPLKLSKDDLDRVCLIPKKKGANFRDLPGVLVGPDNKVEWDPSMERVMLPSGKPLVPEYAMSFVQRRGISTKPFGRLWWDEIVPTVVTRAEPHKKTLLHPLQDRVLTIRENARLQGFPDCYQLSGPVKERYIQVGNAVAFPVALALGYTFGLACQGLSNDQPVRWKGYGSSEDTWEPIEGLSNCKERLQEFVKKGYKSKILPLPGDVDIICGGPSCQGVSGFKRFRNKEAPLDDVKNRQLLVFVDIIDYLKPRYVLMENVVDILKFAGGFRGRYAVGRLVSMNYQARLGMMAAGSYGLPQFRMRVFLWGACPTEKLPQYPLPTHKAKGTGFIRVNEFEDIHARSDNDDSCMMQEALCLEDAISDLPPLRVTNDESQDARSYGTKARTEFQRYIRLKRNDVVSYMADVQSVPQPSMLYDHRPYMLNKDDLDRVCLIPKKCANFRDLPGVLVGEDKKVAWDPSIPREMLPSGKSLVPEYAMTYVKGKSMKPFGRLWWDEILPTVVTRAEPHNQAILHPLQDRVLTIRESASLQGFPDCYQLYGPVKERYIQVGNAVAVPVALAPGYTFGLACQGLSDDRPVTTLPLKFPKCLARSSSAQT